MKTGRRSRLVLLTLSNKHRVPHFGYLRIQLNKYNSEIGFAPEEQNVYSYDAHAKIFAPFGAKLGCPASADARTVALLRSWEIKERTASYKHLAPNGAKRQTMFCCTCRLNPPLPSVATRYQSSSFSILTNLRTRQMLVRRGLNQKALLSRFVTTS